MKVLLDHNIPIGLAKLIQGHEIKSAASQGWAVLGNGDLIAAAEMFGFEIMITADQGIEHQQSLKNRRIALVVLSTNHWATLRAGVRRIAEGMGVSQAWGIPEHPL